jgi:glucose/arabinose dehydrogenase
MRLVQLLGSVFIAACLTACGEHAVLTVNEGVGAEPRLPPPNPTPIPTVKIAEAVGWPAGVTPTAGPGLQVRAFATGLEHPRWLEVLPNGDVLVAETNAPPKPEDGKGLKGWFMKQFMKKAGAGVPSANRITLLRDSNGDGAADQRFVFASGLNAPFGMALVGEDFYVADTDAVLHFHYASGDTALDGEPTRLTDLPAGPINHHWTKSLIASPDGARLYATVGSNSNVGENGMAAEAGRAAIWEIDRETGARRLFASGLRNPNGMFWQPDSGMLWVTVNERDEIGSDLVPDFMTSVRRGAFYGWPYSYYGGHVDARVTPPRPDLVATAVKPDYALGPHTASLGLAWSGQARLLPPQYRHGAFVGQHGSWNRRPPSGYRVIYVPFTGPTPSGPPVDVLTGFLDAQGHARGRPVGVALDSTGALLVADDVGNAVWRVTGSGAAAPGVETPAANAALPATGR